MRACIVRLCLGLALIGATAAAQTAPLDRMRLDSLQQGNMRAEEQANILRRNEADLRGAIADQQRRQTQDNLRAVELRAAPPPAWPVTPLQATPIPSPAQSAGDARLRASSPAP